MTDQLSNPEEEAKLKLEAEIRSTMDIAKSMIWEAVSKDEALAKSLIQVHRTPVCRRPPRHPIPA